MGTKKIIPKKDSTDSYGFYPMVHPYVTIYVMNLFVQKKISQKKMLNPLKIFCFKRIFFNSPVKPFGQYLGSFSVVTNPRKKATKGPLLN